MELTAAHGDILCLAGLFLIAMGKHTLKQPPKFTLHRIISKFLGMVLINEGRYIISNILFVKVS